MSTGKRIQLGGFGSIPKTHLKPRFKDGVRCINGRQVNLIIAKGIDAGLSGDKLLEFLEFECDVKVSKLEDVPDGAAMQRIISKLNERG